ATSSIAANVRATARVHFATARRAEHFLNAVTASGLCALGQPAAGCAPGRLFVAVKAHRAHAVSADKAGSITTVRSRSSFRFASVAAGFRWQKTIFAGFIDAVCRARAFAAASATGGAQYC